MMEWTNVSEKRPKNGQVVAIKIDKCVLRVLYDNGRFWKKRVGKNAGQTWNPSQWMPMKEKIIEDDISSESKQAKIIPVRRKRIKEEENGIES